MDPFSAEGELLTLHTAFHQAQYPTVLSFDTTTLSTPNRLPARILQYRARIAQGEAPAVLESLASDPSASTPDIAAVKILAQHVAEPENPDSRARAQELAKKEGDNLSVQLCCGTVLAGTGAGGEAVALLMRHQGSLDAVALLVQIHLAQNRLDLAQQEVRRAKSWAQDNLLVNLAESWVGLREGGEKYQSAFYIYEELATSPSTTSPHTLLAQAIAELHLGRLPEAEAALQQALAAAPEDEDVWANALVLWTVLGREKEAGEAREKVLGGWHGLGRELRGRREAFGVAAGKWNPKFEVEA